MIERKQETEEFSSCTGPEKLNLLKHNEYSDDFEHVIPLDDLFAA